MGKYELAGDGNSNVGGHVRKKIIISLLACVALVLICIGAGTIDYTTHFANIQVETNAVVKGNVTSASVVGTNSGTFGSATVNTNLTVGAQSGFTGFTVANLPTGVGVGYQTYCTDCLTPWGTGDRVEWDGTSWTTLRQRVLATTNHLIYLLSATTNTAYTSTLLSDIGSSPEISTAIWNFPRAASTASGTIVTINQGTEATGSYMSFSTSTSATAAPRASGYYFQAMVEGGYYGCGGSYAVSVVPSDTETYWAVVGFDSATAGTLPTTGAYFLYDKYNAAGRAGLGAETNNWLCVTSEASSSTYADSGLAVSTSTTAPDRLAVIMTTTAVYFFTNGVVCATNTATIPSLRMYANKTMIVKTLGTTSRSLYEANPWYHIRRAAARTY